MTNFTDVSLFHQKFGLPHLGDGSPPRLLSPDEFWFRYEFLKEELTELLEAHSRSDLPGFLDALVDLCYVAMGTAHLAGLPFDAAWDEVQRANLTKVRATGADDPLSKRGHALDVVKPPGWTPPDINGVIARHVVWLEYEALVREVGGGFHPDTQSDGYDPPLPDPARYDRVVAAAFAAGDRCPYEVGLAVFDKMDIEER